MLTHRLTVRGMLTLATVVVLAGCTGGSQPSAAAVASSGAAPSQTVAAAASGVPQSTAQASPSASGPQVLVYASPTTFPDLDPSTGFSDDSAVVSNLYETLTRYAPPGSNPQIQPLLATDWSQSTDGLTWTFHLRPNVKFHDGTPVNAAAVKWSIERTMKLGQGGAFIWDPVSSISAPDDLTVVFTLKYKAPMDLIVSSGYAAWIMSPTTAEGKDNAWFNAGHDAGSGPYMLDSYEKDQRAILKKFDGYWGGWKPGQFDTVILKVVQDAAARQQMIESGDADYTFTIPTDNLSTLSANPDVKVVANPSYQNMMILLNTVKSPTSNLQVRQALAASFPYQDVIQGTMAGYATQSRGAVPASLLDGVDQVPQASFSLDQAKSLLAQAGYANGGLNLVMTFTAGDTQEQQAGELWAADLAKIGVNLEVRSMAWEAQWSLAKGDPNKAQDGFMFYWWPTYATPYDFMFNLFHSEKSPNFNLGYYNNPAYDTLIDQANTQLSSDRAGAMAKFVQADTMLVNDAAAIFVYDLQNIHVIRSSLQGFVDNPAYPHVLFAYTVSR